MEDIPVFLDLIRTNALLYSIIASGSFSSVDLKSPDNHIWSEKVIELRNFALSESEVFSSVVIRLSDIETNVRFMTTKSDYFDRAKYYFDYETLSTKNSSYLLDGMHVSTETKVLSSYYLLSPVQVVSTTLFNSSLYGYMISMSFGKDEKKSSPIFFVENYKTSKNIILFFKPQEVKVTSEYSPDRYTPHVRISVKRKKHPLLKYFESKSCLYYEGKLYEHNDIPHIRPTNIGEIVFHPDSPGKPAFLEVVPNKVDSKEKNISYDFKKPAAKFYCIDSIMMTKDELKMRRINLKKDFRLSEVVFGKEAYDRFGSPQYSEGVSIYYKSTCK